MAPPIDLKAKVQDQFRAQAKSKVEGGVKGVLGSISPALLAGAEKAQDAVSRQEFAMRTARTLAKDGPAGAMCFMAMTLGKKVASKKLSELKSDMMGGAQLPEYTPPASTKESRSIFQEFERGIGNTALWARQASQNAYTAPEITQEMRDCSEAAMRSIPAVSHADWEEQCAHAPMSGPMLLVIQRCDELQAYAEKYDIPSEEVMYIISQGFEAVDKFIVECAEKEARMQAEQEQQQVAASPSQPKKGGMLAKALSTSNTTNAFTMGISAFTAISPALSQCSTQNNPLAAEGKSTRLADSGPKLR